MQSKFYLLKRQLGFMDLFPLCIKTSEKPTTSKNIGLKPVSFQFFMPWLRSSFKYILMLFPMALEGFNFLKQFSQTAFQCSLVVVVCIILIYYIIVNVILNRGFKQKIYFHNRYLFIIITFHFCLFKATINRTHISHKIKLRAFVIVFLYKKG